MYDFMSLGKLLHNLKELIKKERMHGHVLANGCKRCLLWYSLGATRWAAIEEIER